MDVDLVVRTYNTLYARGARRRGWPDYPIRLALAAEKIHEDWPHQIGLIGLQEAAGATRYCHPDDRRRRSITACFASHLGRRFGADVRCAANHELGTLWDGVVWERIPGGGTWRIDRRHPRLSGLRFDVGSPRYLLAVRLRLRSSGRELSFFNTHLANDPPRRRERERQLDRLLEIVDRTVAPGELPPILVGDFNLTPDESTTFDRLWQRFWLANSPGLPGSPPRTGVDQIWIGRSEHFSQVRGQFEVVRVHTSEENERGLELRRHQISDHPLVSVSLRIVPPLTG